MVLLSSNEYLDANPPLKVTCDLCRSSRRREAAMVHEISEACKVRPRLKHILQATLMIFPSRHLARMKGEEWGQSE
jgi:hypothetical protein